MKNSSNINPNELREHIWQNLDDTNLMNRAALEIERLRKIIALYDDRLAPRNLELSIQIDAMRPVVDAAINVGSPQRDVIDLITNLRNLENAVDVYKKSQVK